MAATILVIDDDESIRDLLRIHLSAAGYEVHVAADAIAAGYIVLRSPPDLIICDINMPHMDGFEFVAARDIVEGHRLAMEKGRPGQKYIFSTEFQTVDGLMDIYEALTGQLPIEGSMMAGVPDGHTRAPA